MKKTKLYSAYNYDTDQRSQDTSITFTDDSRAQQHMLHDTDINVIVGRFKKTGLIPAGVVAPTYGDFEGIFDYHDAINAISKANENFDQLPAQIRAQFNNSPAEFVDFCSNGDNHDELVKMGLAEPKMAPEPEPESVAKEPQQSAEPAENTN